MEPTQCYEVLTLCTVSVIFTVRIDVSCGEMDMHNRRILSRTLTMGFHHISRDVKLAAIRLYQLDLLSLEDILQSVGFSERTFYRILALWRVGLSNYDYIIFFGILYCNHIY